MTWLQECTRLTEEPSTKQSKYYIMPFLSSFHRKKTKKTTHTHTQYTLIFVHFFVLLLLLFVFCTFVVGLHCSGRPNLWCALIRYSLSLPECNWSTPTATSNTPTPSNKNKQNTTITKVECKCKTWRLVKDCTKTNNIISMAERMVSNRLCIDFCC